MILIKYNSIKIATIAFLLTASLGLNAQDSYSKEYVEEYAVGQSGEVSITNKYGDVEIKTWNQNTVKIFVEIEVKAKNEDSAEGIWNKISIDFSDLGDQIKAETRIRNNNDGSCNSNSSYKINYLVNMPKYHDLYVSNKYGDVFLNDLDANFNLSLKYGNGNLGTINGDCDFYLGYVDPMRIDDIKGRLDLEMAYSELRAGDIGDLEIESKHSDMTMGNVGDLVVEGKYDDFKILSAKSLDYRGKYDDYELGSVGQVDVKTSYSDIEIKSLSGNADFDLRYGSIDLDQVESYVSSIIVDAEYTDVEIYKEGPFLLDFAGKYTDLSLPDNFESIKNIKEKSRRTIMGYTGNRNAKLNLKAIMLYGEIDIDN